MEAHQGRPIDKEKLLTWRQAQNDFRNVLEEQHDLLEKSGKSMKINGKKCKTKLLSFYY